jgi:phosphate transport system substrate-binding protein
VAGSSPDGAAVKPLMVAATGGSPAVAATGENVALRRYPLARPVYAYFNRGPNESLDPVLAEFLRFVLSADGQDAVRQDGAYLPLTAALAAAQARRLE